MGFQFGTEMLDIVEMRFGRRGRVVAEYLAVGTAGLACVAIAAVSAWTAWEYVLRPLAFYLLVPLYEAARLPAADAFAQASALLAAAASISVAANEYLRRRRRTRPLVHPSVKPLPAVPDEQLVILFRAYGLPAYESVKALLEIASDACFSGGGWPGLAAHLLKYWVMRPGAEKVDALRETIVSSGGSPQVEAFVEFYNYYLKLVALAGHFGSQNIWHDFGRLDQWIELDATLATKIRELAAGLNRERLAPVVGRTEERELLRSRRFTIGS
ncbi:MAG: hypothetical protein AB7G21_13395 [Dehalococcoidia bacterium]